MARVKKMYSMDEKVAAQIDEYAAALGISASAFVALMVSQIGQVLNMSLPLTKKNDAGSSGDD